jgi:hypothetical protein
MARYSSRHPISQDDQFEKAKLLFAAETFSTLLSFVLFCAGMGSGKSRIIVNLASFLNFNGVVCIVLKDKNLMKQMEMNLNEFLDPNQVVLDGSKSNISRIRDLVRVGKQPIVLFSNLRSTSGRFTKTTKLFIDVLKNNRATGCLVLMDEIDSMLTSLTGGMNAKIDHSKTMLDSYIKVRNQIASLNLFDQIRRYGAKVVGFTGTANNLVCSKQPSMGYSCEQIHIINFSPIKAIYENIHLLRGNTDPREIMELYENEIRSVKENEKILIIASTKKDLEECVRSYRRHYGIEMSYVVITKDNEDERQTEAWNLKLQDAKFVLGVNLVGIGYNISTFCEGQEFGLVIICRRLSDWVSQPLASNKYHDLHMQISAPMLQMIARMRKGGLAIIPESVEINSFYDGMRKIYETIRDGRNEMLKVGPPLKTQMGRQHQCLLLSLMQNMRSSNNRPVVQDILDNLYQITDRHFENEYLQDDFDAVYWTDRIGDVWDIFMGEGIQGLEEIQVQAEELVEEPFETEEAEELFESEKAEESEEELLQEEDAQENQVQENQTQENQTQENQTQENQLHEDDSDLQTVRDAPEILGDYLTGGGERNQRVENEEIRTVVIERAEGICGHCGYVCDKSDKRRITQICHVDRYDSGGTYTEDNLILGHICCDSNFDCGFIVYDPDGGTWQHPTIRYKPDQKQWSQINPINIRHRWDWEKARQGFAEKNNNSFRNYLRSNGYSFQE